MAPRYICATEHLLGVWLIESHARLIFRLGDANQQCMPSLRFCVTGFPNYGTSTATLVNQCDVDIAGSFSKECCSLPLPVYFRSDAATWHRFLQCKCCSFPAI